MLCSKGLLMLQDFIVKLDELHITYKSEGAVISIQLPSEFGVLEYRELSDNDDILGLVGGSWHTHGSVEGGVMGLALLVKNMFSGKLLLIKEVSPSNEERRTIEGCLEDYLKWLPEGTNYEIYNKA